MSQMITFDHNISHVEGFEIHTLSNNLIKFSIAPELGARVVSILDIAAGREWLDGWSPANYRRIGRPTDPVDFSTGPGAGLDECLPTVLPCRIGDMQLADHGELWNRPTGIEVDVAQGSISSQWRLQSLPLTFTRVLSLQANRLNFQYRLENLADCPTPFQWAWHPLFTFEEGDHLCFLNHPISCIDPDGTILKWPESSPGCDLSHANLSGLESKCAKVFIGPLEIAHVRIETASPNNLEIEWPTEWFPYAGIWITRGGWKGLHHWAIEPTNIPVDRLSDTIGHPGLVRLATLGARESRIWHVNMTFGSRDQN